MYITDVSRNCSLEQRPLCASKFINARWKWPVPGRPNKYEMNWLQAGGCSKQGDGVTHIARGSSSHSYLYSCLILQRRGNKKWVVNEQIWVTKTSGLRDMNKGRSGPRSALVPHSRKYGNNLDEIDPLCVLPLSTLKARQMQLFLSDIVIFKF